MSLGLLSVQRGRAREWRGLVVVVLSLVVLAGAMAVALPVPVALAIGAEHGPLETLQVMLLLAAVPFVWSNRRDRNVGLAVALTVLLLAMAARELDWHKTWTAGNLLKIDFYVGPTPVAQKFAGALVLVTLGAAIVHLLRYAPDLRNGLKLRRPWAVTIVTFIGVLLVARIVDKSLLFAERYLDVVGTPRAIAMKMLVEEALELALPLLAILAALQSRQAPAASGEPATMSQREVDIERGGGGDGLSPARRNDDEGAFAPSGRLQG